MPPPNVGSSTRCASDPCTGRPQSHGVPGDAGDPMKNLADLSGNVRPSLFLVTAVLAVFGPVATVQSHGTEGRYMEVLDWKKEHIARTFGSNRAHLDGMISTSNPVQAKMIDGKSCVVGDL